MHDHGGVKNHIEPDLVHQRDWPDRKPERNRRFIDLVNRNALRDQAAGFVQIRGEQAVDPEPRTVAHHNGRLPHPLPQRDRRDCDPRRSAVGDDHLQERHAIHRRKEVHPDDPLRPPGRFRDPIDRNRAGIRSQNAVVTYL